MAYPKKYPKTLYTRVTEETKDDVVKKSGGGRNESKYVRDAVIHYNKLETLWKPKK